MTDVSPRDAALAELQEHGVARDVASRALDAVHTADNKHDASECV